MPDKRCSLETPLVSRSFPHSKLLQAVPGYPPDPAVVTRLDVIRPDNQYAISITVTAPFVYKDCFAVYSHNCCLVVYLAESSDLPSSFARRHTHLVWKSNSHAERLPPPSEEALSSTTIPAGLRPQLPLDMHPARRSSVVGFLHVSLGTNGHCKI